MPSSLSSNDELLQNYEILRDVKTVCKREGCSFKDDYIKLQKFTDHMKQAHKNSTWFEINVATIGFPFIHFTFCETGQYKDCIQCVHCQKYAFNKRFVAIGHIVMHLTEYYTFTTHGLKENEWMWKYCEKKEENVFQVKCLRFYNNF